MVNMQEAKRAPHFVDAEFDVNLLKKLLEKVMDQLTTQHIPEFYNAFFDWIIFQSENYLHNKATDYDKDNSPPKQFHLHHPEAFWAAQVIVDVFCDYVIPEILLDADAESIDLNWESRQICNTIGVQLFDQLWCLSNSLDPDFVIGLSGEKYESAGAKGLALAIVPSENFVPASLRFSTNTCLPLEMTYIHAIRKQLNMANNGALAVCRDVKNGQFHTVGIIPQGMKDSFPRFVFTGHMEWKFCVPVKPNENDCRLRYHQGSLKLPIVDLSLEIKIMHQSQFNKDGTDNIAKIIRSIDKIGQGAVIVFSSPDTIAAESHRLVNECGRGTCFQELIDVCNTDNSEDLLRRFTSIDGAVFVDEKGYCHACGVILDGEAKTGSGESGRGARFNCTKTYISVACERYPNSNILGIVKSEDGMLDFFDRTTK